MSFGENLKKFRTDSNLTQRQFSEKLGFSQQVISDWESGKSKPRLDAILQISEKLNVSADILLK
jgi:transcriptional regulator with XRE-family HTH domain